MAIGKFPFFYCDNIFSQVAISNEGGVSAKKESMEYLLNQPGKGKALCLVIGANEDLLASIPYKMELTVSCRKGFIKMAIRYG
jgi:hypothetical protein